MTDEKKNRCRVLGTNEQGDGITFTCHAMDPEYSDGYAGCSFTGGYKNRCPHRNNMECNSKWARLDALEKFEKAIERERHYLRKDVIR